MPLIETKYFGTMPYQEESVFEFPLGLPAFENQKQFVLMESPENAPLLLLQSVAQASLCFLAFPVEMVESGYKLTVSREDRLALELDPDREPESGGEVLALALLSLHDGLLPTANLMAPVVVNLKTRRALQSIRSDSAYSHQHPMIAEEPC